MTTSFCTFCTVDWTAPPGKVQKIGGNFMRIRPKFRFLHFLHHFAPFFQSIALVQFYPSHSLGAVESQILRAEVFSIRRAYVLMRSLTPGKELSGVKICGQKVTPFVRCARAEREKGNGISPRRHEVHEKWGKEGNR